MSRLISKIALRRSLAVGTAAVSLLALGACGSTDDGHGSMPGMGGTSMSSSGATSDSAAMTDVMFAQMMIPHHQQAIDMADLALESSSGASAQVRALAQQIAAAQGPEIALMQGWLKDWGAGTGMPMGHDMTGMMSDTDMEALSTASGEDFDRQWLTMMIEHHEGAITMAQNVLRSTKNAEVEKLATAIVEGQEKEIATMKGLLA